MNKALFITRTVLALTLLASMGTSSVAHAQTLESVLLGPPRKSTETECDHIARDVQSQMVLSRLDVMTLKLRENKYLPAFQIGINCFEKNEVKGDPQSRTVPAFLVFVTIDVSGAPKKWDRKAFVRNLVDDVVSKLEKRFRGTLGAARGIWSTLFKKHSKENTKKLQRETKAVERAANAYVKNVLTKVIFEGTRADDMGRPQTFFDGYLERTVKDSNKKGHRKQY